MAETINLNKGTYTYKGKTYAISGGVNAQQAQQITNAVNDRQAQGKNDVSLSNDTSGYYKQGGTGNLMYNGKSAITNMYADGNGYAVTQYSNGTMKYNDQKTGKEIDANTYNNIMKNNSALGTLNNSVQGLSNTYNYSNQGSNVNTSNANNSVYNPTKFSNNANLSVKNLGSYQFGTEAELAEKNSPGYLDSRNTELAQLLSSNGVLDKQGIGDFLSQYSGFANYDQTGQQNTINNIYAKMMELQTQNGQQPAKQQINLNSPFMQTVDSILKSAYGIDNLDAIKDMYGAENYYNLMNALKDVEGTWNATDPESRSKLQGQLQEIIGAVVGTGVDQSKLNLNMEAVLSQFTPEARSKIEQDVLDVQNLQTRGYNVEQIAKQTGMSTDQVNQLLLLNQGLPSQIGKYYDLNSETEDYITEDYERARENLTANYKFNLEQANQQLDQIKEDFNKTYLDQQEANENTLHNMDLIAGMTGTGYSRRGLEGMSYAQQQANAVLNNLIDNYDRSNLDIANSVKSLTMAYRQQDAELVDQMNDAIMNAKNNYITQVSNIQAKYGLVGLEGQQAIAQAVQGFVDQAETIYNNAFNRAWTNTNNLISAVSNIGALEQQQIQTRQMKIAEFQQDSMYMTQSQIADYAQKNGLQMSYDQLVGYQQEATINTLNSVSPGLGNQYAQKINQMLASGYTPQQAVSEILNSPDVQGSVSGDRAISGDYMYDKNTGEVRLLSQMVNGGNTSYYDTGAVQQAVAQATQQWTGQYTEGQQINKQCGAFVNDYLESMGLGRVFTDPIEKKKAAMNSDTPTVGSVVVMESPYENTKQYGHVAIVTGINGDGTMNVARANTNGDKAYHTGKMNINSKSILGYYDPAKAVAEQSGGTTTQQNNGYDPSLEYVFENMLANDGKLDSTTQNNLLKYGYSMQSIGNQYNAYKQSKGVTENTYKLPDGFTITDQALFNQMNEAEKKSIKGTLTSYNTMMASADKLKELVLKYGAEVRPTSAKNQMQQYVRDIQLQAKELYNLGVLNGPDLSLMEEIIYNPASFKAKWQSIINLRNKQDVRNLVENGINTVNNQAIEKLKNYGIGVAGSGTTTNKSSGRGL